MPLHPKQQPPYYQDGTSVKQYTAIHTQTGTAAPIATILQNNLPTIIWTRSDAGTYIGTSTNNFNATKMTIDITLQPNGNAQIIRAGVQNDNEIQILTTQHDDTPSDDNSWYITIKYYNNV